MATTIGEAIRRTRLDRGMTQAQLADALGISQPRMSAIERGETPPGLPQIQAIETALGVKPGHVLRAAGQVAPDEEGQGIDYVEVSTSLNAAISALEDLARALGMRADSETQRNAATRGKSRKSNAR